MNAVRTLAIILVFALPSLVIGQSVDERFARAMELTESIETTVREIEKRADALAVWFGLPDDATRERTRLNAERLLDLSSRASATITDAIEESDREGVGDASVRDSLIQVQSGRLHLRRARALLLLASLEDEPRDRGEHRRGARAAMEEIRGTSPWIDRESALLDAVASMLEGEHARAREEFNAMRLDLEGADDPDIQNEFAPPVNLGLIVSTLNADGWARARTAARALLDSPPFVVDDRRDPALATIAADVRARVDMARAEVTVAADSRSTRLADVFSHYEELASVYTASGMGERAGWRLAIERAGHAAQRWERTDLLPAMALAGLATGLSAEDATVERGIELARAALERDPPSGLRRETAWLLARSLASRPRHRALVEACSLATDLAREDPFAKDALQLASACAMRLTFTETEPQLSIATDALRLAHERGGLQGIGEYRAMLASVVARAHTPGAYREAIRIVETLEPGEELDAARALESASFSESLTKLTGENDDARMWLARARRASNLSDGIDEYAARVSEVLALVALDRINEGLESARSLWADASANGDDQALGAGGWALVEACRAAEDFSALVQPIDRLVEIRDPHYAYAAMHRALGAIHEVRVEPTGLFLSDKADLGAADDLAVLRAMAEWSAGAERPVSRDRIDEARVVVAILGGRSDAAVRVADELIARGGGSLDRQRLLAESRIAAGDDAGAFGVLRSLASATPRSELDWYAWTRMLEILSRQNSDGSRTDTIRREITRLRATDGYGGCGPCAERIERLARSVGMDD